MAQAFQGPAEKGPGRTSPA